jgi:hypothetical protein
VLTVPASTTTGIPGTEKSKLTRGGDVNDKFEWNADGDIVARPILGWDAAIVAENVFVLRLTYMENERKRKIQIELTPQQALSLADLLKTAADQIQAPRPPKGSKPS